MSALLSRAVMALAMSCISERRRDWALAMEVELEAAREDGKPLSFASGCLIAAWRELPTHEEGRFLIASHLLAFLLMIPIAALVASSMLADFPYSYLGSASGGQGPVLSDGNRSALPSLAALLVLLAVSHLRIAWLVLERDWSRLAAATAMAAAATMSLILFTALVFAHSAAAPAQAALLAMELAAISALARWHARSFEGPPEAPT
jgi:hypothetical protein